MVLKRLALIAMFLSIIQASMPILGQAPDHVANGPGSVNGHTDGRQGETAPSLASAQITQGKPDGNSGQNKVSDTKTQSVTVREFPTVSVSKDWADWGYWGFGGLLVIVGFLQVRLITRQANLMKEQIGDARASSAEASEIAPGTLKAIEDQAKLMALQTEVMQEQSKAAVDSATAARTSAEAARKSVELAASQLEMAERPWISVKVFKSGDITYDHLGINISIQIAVSNIGKTPATKVDIEQIIYFLGGNRRATEIRDTLIRNMRPNRIMTSFTVFPGESENITVPLLCHDKTRKFETMRDIAGSRGEVICAVAIVCVTYRPVFEVLETKLPYYTGVIYNIHAAGAGGKIVPVLKPNETVRYGDVSMSPIASDGTVAG
jgi:hypothetical protein